MNVFVVRIVIDGSESHVVEWSSIGEDRVEEFEEVAIAVGRLWLHRARHDLVVEVRRDGERWMPGNRWTIRPVLEAVRRA